MCPIDYDSLYFDSLNYPPEEREDRMNRSVLDSYVMWNERSKLKEVPGYRLVATAQERPPGEFCYWYAFGKEVYGNEVDAMLTDYDEVTEYRPGDIITYWDKSGDIKHAGVYQGDGKVISKFAVQGDLWEHPTLLVPGMYGDNLRGFRKPNEIIPQKNLSSQR